jgi:hypothetical protein
VDWLIDWPYWLAGGGERFIFGALTIASIMCHSSQCITVNKQTPSDRHTGYRGAVVIPCSYTQPDPAWVDSASWLSLIWFWPGANYIISRTSHFFSLSSSLLFYNIMAWLQKQINLRQLDPNRAERQAL